jgi:very-short-patch-repair endonuclease
VRWSLTSQAWQRIYPGVYATFTGPITPESRLWAVLLHAGPEALLSHETAAKLLGLSDRPSATMHVTIPHGKGLVPPPGVAVHKTRYAMPRWRFARGVPPHTMTEDTVIDLVNAAKTLDEAVGWVTAAFARRLTSERMLRQAMAERSRVRWRREIDEVIALAAGGTHSVLEFRYDRDVERAHGLPPSQRQAPFTRENGRRGFRDRCYAQYGRLVIELDGRQYHPDEGRDRVRDNQAAAGGGATLRYDWTAVTRRPCQTAAEVLQALSERGYRGRLKPCGRCTRPAHAGGVVSDGGWPGAGPG